MRVLRPCSTQSVNHCSHFLLPPPPLSPAHRIHTHLHAKKNHVTPAAYIPLYHSPAPPTLYSLDDKMKDADIHLFSVAVFKGILRHSGKSAYIPYFKARLPMANEQP